MKAKERKRKIAEMFIEFSPLPCLCHPRPWNRNEYTLKPSPRIYWRASLVPAAAVIPAPIAYIKVVAVKKLVVEFLRESISCGLNELQRKMIYLILRLYTVGIRFLTVN